MSSETFVGCEARIEQVEGGWRAVHIFYPGTTAEQSFASVVFPEKRECEQASREFGVWLMDNWKRLSEEVKR